MDPRDRESQNRGARWPGEAPVHPTGMGPRLAASSFSDSTILILSLPSGSGAEEVLCDDHALDLARAFADLAELGVAKVALHRELAGVAVAAMDL